VKCKKCGGNRFVTRYENNKPINRVCTNCKTAIPYESLKKESIVKHTVELKSEGGK
jgi:transcription initiation factor TFIIIB Brf1 subunit/transcription initiation factor TFIIB